MNLSFFHNLSQTQKTISIVGVSILAALIIGIPVFFALQPSAEGESQTNTQTGSDTGEKTQLPQPNPEDKPQPDNTDNPNTETDDNDSPEATSSSETGSATTPVPTQPGSVVTALAKRNDTTTFTTILELAEVGDSLEEEGPFTVFAPDDKAFEKLSETELEGLLDPENNEKTVAFILRHIIPGSVQLEDLEDGENIQTLSGDILSVTVDGDIVTLNDSVQINKENIEASNGVIHVCDTVL